jgi:hypothetical protein
MWVDDVFFVGSPLFPLLCYPSMNYSSSTSEGLDINSFCSYKALELRTNLLSYIPRGDREKCIEAIVADYRRESRLARVSQANPLPQYSLPSQRIQYGMKTALSTTPNPCFSTPTSYGSSNATLLQKQRKAEHRALRAVDQRLASSSSSSRKLPW